MEPKQSGTDGTEHETPQKGDRGGGWQFPVLLAVLLLGLVTVAIRTPRWQAPHGQALRMPGSAAAWKPSPQPTGETVSLSIDFGNGTKKEFTALSWRPEMTVADLMEAARQFRPGLRFTQIGAGGSGFLSSLDGLANQGAGGRNWIYQVDGQHAHVSFCLEKLEPGTHILWTFTDAQYNSESP